MSPVHIETPGNVNIGGDVVGRDKITINLPPPLPPAEAKDRANLLILLRKVKTFWIEGVLEKSLHNAVLIELGKETKSDAVDHPWGMVLELPDQTNQVLPSGTKIIDIFEKMNRAMLILGEPGSGKTITLLELARDLITRAEADPTQPIPVVFNLSSWTDKRQPLHDWLVFELSTKYQIPKRIGRAWLKDNRILPLLDGLDEVKLENRASCVDAINHFGETLGLPGRVVCSRVKEYTGLPVRLKLNGAICLLPLTLAQVNSYLEAGGNKLAALRSVFQKDDALQELAQFPLMLNIISFAYQDVAVEILNGQTHEKIEDRRKHLFDSYIERMFKRKGKTTQPYTADQTISWLIWLASNMRRHNQTVFLVEQLQPNCLQTRGQKLFYSIGSRFIVGIVIGLFFGLTLKLLFDINTLLLILFFGAIGFTIGFLKLRKISVEKINFVEDVKFFWIVVRLEMKIMIAIWTHGMASNPIGPFVPSFIPMMIIQLATSFSKGFFPIIITIDRIDFSRVIRQSFKKALMGGFIGVLYGVAYGFIAGLLLLLYFVRDIVPEIMVTGVAVILYIQIVVVVISVSIFGVIAGFRSGGLAIIQHFILRFILNLKKYTPWNYARFLDYAAKLIFLQKVGGGYIFIHRLLLEHFAAMQLPGKTQKK